MFVCNILQVARVKIRNREKRGEKTVIRLTEESLRRLAAKFPNEYPMPMQVPPSHTSMDCGADQPGGRGRGRSQTNGRGSGSGRGRGATAGGAAGSNAAGSSTAGSSTAGSNAAGSSAAGSSAAAGGAAGGSAAAGAAAAGSAAEQARKKTKRKKGRANNSWSGSESVEEEDGQEDTSEDASEEASDEASDEANEESREEEGEDDEDEPAPIPDNYRKFSGDWQPDCHLDAFMLWTRLDGSVPSPRWYCLRVIKVLDDRKWTYDAHILGRPKRERRGVKVTMENYKEGVFIPLVLARTEQVVDSIDQHGLVSMRTCEGGQSEATMHLNTKATRKRLRLPFHCETCKEVDDFLYTPHDSRDGEVPNVKCRKCKPSSTWVSISRADFARAVNREV